MRGNKKNQKEPKTEEEKVEESVDEIIQYAKNVVKCVNFATDDSPKKLTRKESMNLKKEKKSKESKDKNSRA